MNAGLTAASATPPTISTAAFKPLSATLMRNDISLTFCRCRMGRIPPRPGGISSPPLGLPPTRASGARRQQASAPLQVCRKRQREPPALFGQHHLEARHVEPAGVGQVEAIKPGG